MDEERSDEYRKRRIPQATNTASDECRKRQCGLSLTVAIILTHYFLAPLVIAFRPQSCD
jgi:hypothetical protein